MTYMSHMFASKNEKFGLFSLICMQHTSWQDRLLSTISARALHSSKTLVELNFTLFLSPNFKMNGQFGFGQRNDPIQSLNLTVSYPFHFVLESFFPWSSISTFSQLVCTIGSFYGICFHSTNVKRYVDYFLVFGIFPNTFPTDFMSLQIHHHSNIVITITRVATGITYQDQTLCMVVEMDGFRRYWDYSNKHPLRLFNFNFIRGRLLEACA